MPSELEYRGNTYRFDTGTAPSMTDEDVAMRPHWLVKKGDVVLDIGAAFGAYTLPACAVGAHVFAFEPHKPSFRTLLKNLKLNSWGSKRCTPLSYGLWNKATKIKYKSYATHTPDNDTFPMKTLDSQIKDLKLKKVDWIKIDTEGAEARILRGGKKILKTWKPNMMVEIHGFVDITLLEQTKEAILSANEDYEILNIPRRPGCDEGRQRMLVCT